MKKGFTLIELLLVVTILGILAAVAIPKLFPQTEYARTSEAIALLTAIQQAEKAHFLEQGEYVGCSQADTACWENNLGMENPNLLAKYFTYYTEAWDDSGAGLLDGFWGVAQRSSVENPDQDGNGFGDYNCAMSVTADGIGGGCKYTPI